MTITRSVLACALALASIGCGGGSGSTDVVNPPSTQMSLSATPASLETGQATTYTVTASNSSTVLTSTSIDFENDGVWDQTRPHNQSSITDTFSHTYVNAGTYIARAEVIDANQTPTTKTTQVTVVVPALVPVTFTASAQSMYNGVCGTFGPPMSCSGCSGPLSTTETSPYSLAAYGHGATATVSQAFKQQQSNQLNNPFACAYHLYLYAGTPGSVVRIGSATCYSTSDTTPFDPTQMQCTATASGVVP